MQNISDLATHLLKHAIAEAEALNLPIAVSVVDAGGHLVAHHRMAGVSYMANDVVRRKATTACTFHMPTHILYTVLQTQPELRFAVAAQPDVLAVSGGLPIVVGGVCMGGLGVGGGRFEQDLAIAEKALAAIREHN